MRALRILKFPVGLTLSVTSEGQYKLDKGSVSKYYDILQDACQEIVNHTIKHKLSCIETPAIKEMSEVVTSTCRELRRLVEKVLEGENGKETKANRSTEGGGS